MGESGLGWSRVVSGAGGISFSLGCSGPIFLMARVG